MSDTYTRVNWEDSPSTNTPISAENLNKMDKGIEDAHKKCTEISETIDDKITSPTSAEVGQILSVVEVDENGKPTKWQPIDKPTGGSDVVDCKKTYNNLSQMLSNTGLVIDDVCETVGFYNIFDNGGATYKIRAKATDEVANGMSTHETSNGLIAVLCVEDYTVNICQLGAKSGGMDCTSILQYAFDNYRTVYIPNGSFNHKGNIAVNTHGFTLVGNNYYNSSLNNTSNTDSFIGGRDVEFVNIKNLRFNGTWSDGKTEEESTKNCFRLTFNVLWNFDTCFFVGHYGYAIEAGGEGHVNNITVKRCEARQGYKGGLSFVARNNCQINGIYIDMNNITGFKKNGIDVWGNNITITNNTIQACTDFGICSDKLQYGNDVVYGSCGSLTIDGNYFELCYKSFIYCKTNVGTGGHGEHQALTIINNYGNYMYPTATDEEKAELDTYGIVDLRGFNNGIEENNRFGRYNIIYKNNSFQQFKTSNYGEQTETKYLINTHGEFSEHCRGEIVFGSVYRDKNIDISPSLNNTYNGTMMKAGCYCLNIKPFKVFEPLWVVQDERTVASNVEWNGNITYKHTLKSGYDGFLFSNNLTKLNGRKGTLTFMFRTNYVGGDIRVGVGTSMKSLDSESFNAYSNAENVYTSEDVAGEKWIQFKKEGVAYGFMFGDNLARLKFNLHTSTVQEGAYFEIKNPMFFYEGEI